MQLQRGQKVKFNDVSLSPTFTANCRVQSSLTIDVSCFGINEQGKLEDDRYMIFYNQKVSPQQEIKFSQENDQYRFDINAEALPSKANKLVFTVAIDGQGDMTQLQKLDFSIGQVTFTLTGADFNKEKAIIVAEIYKKDGLWRINAVGQGFNGGLEALLNSFGGQVATPVVPVQTQKTIFLEKRLSLEKTIAREAPKLVDLTKKAAVSLEKKGLGEHRAKVALCLDISISMRELYQRGIIQEFVERILALGCRLDDDGSIDIFLFGEEGHQPDPITIKDFNGYINRILRLHPLEPDTRYAKAIELVREFYTPYKYERSEPLSLDMPVYVMFLTDGQPSDKAQATKAIKNASFEPIFWQFMGVGSSNFSYLEKLDDLSDRYVDNADFFSVSDLKHINDEQLYEKLMNEYPSWLKMAHTKRLLK